MRVTLIQPQYGNRLPLGVVYLACGLEKENIDFEIKLFRIENLFKSKGSIDRLYSFLINSREIIALGCYSDMFPHAIVALKKIKQKFPKKIIILGGIGPTMVAEEILDSFDFVDFILKGNGISSLPKLVKRINAGGMEFNDIPGLLVRNRRTHLSNNFDVLGLDMPKIPAYSCIKDIDLYNEFYIKTSAGCPFQCTFCYALPATGKKVINRDISEVIEEIRLIREITQRRKIRLNIIDEAFVVNKRRVMKFCGFMRKSKLKVPWACYGRVNCMDEEMLRNMRMAGCIEVYYGVESGSDQILKKIKKGFTIDEAMKVILLSEKIIPRVIASFIYRFPFETLMDFKYTLLALKYLQSRRIVVQLHPLAPVKNSQIYLEYGNRLKFSLKEYCDYISSHTPSITEGTVSYLPHQCIELIKKYPNVFYDYGYYDSEDLHKINQLITKNI